MARTRTLDNPKKLLRAIDPELDPNNVRSVMFGHQAITVEVFTGRYEDTATEHLPGMDDNDEREDLTSFNATEVIDTIHYVIVKTT